MANDSTGVLRPTCSTCPWYDSHGGARGFCRFDSPSMILEEEIEPGAARAGTVLIGHGTAGRWPHVNGMMDWCRNHPQLLRLHIEGIFDDSAVGASPLEEFIIDTARLIVERVDEGAMAITERLASHDAICVVTLPTAESARGLLRELRTLQQSISKLDDGKATAPASEADEG